jgi:single-strand DNA-binding protein
MSEYGRRKPPMATFNQCQFIGRLGKNPEQTVVNGSPVTKFSLAVDQGKDQKPLWLNISTWDRLAEVVKQYARKGMQVFVQGKLVLRSYQDKNKVDRVAIDIIATTVQLLEKRQSEGEDIPVDSDAPMSEK